MDRVERFWAKVDKSGPVQPHCPDLGQCWVWTGCKRTGYGLFAVGNRRSVGAHRFSWAIAHGQIPHGMCVLHRCDNPACVRPEHLFLGTQLENIADRSAKSRQARGEKAPTARLSEEDVAEIRRLRAEGNTITAIGRMFGVHHSHVSSIHSRKAWRHLQ